MRRQYELVEKIRKYNPDTDEALINKAYVFAMYAHQQQKRANGDPYFSHPIEVACILTELCMDDTTIITALLHDTIEDTTITRGDIAREFGETVAMLVDGVTKLTKLELEEVGKNFSAGEKQAENFRKLIIAVADDIRVLLVKLADRLHNMRTLDAIKKPEKRRRIAIETKELYAPLAGRIGVQFIREELEDLSFRVINAEARDSIISRLETLNKQNPNFLADIQKKFTDALEKAFIDVVVRGRIKSPFSIYEKMNTKNLEFEQLSDVIGFRILTNSVSDCYHALGIIHQKFNHIPGRFKDYISVPKRNGYQSIHTAVRIKEQQVELQIRTHDIHEYAEKGVAAHWNYKKNSGDNPVKYQWIKDLVNDTKSDGATDFLEYTKMEIFHDQVFCFTPKGRIIRLPRGATAVDFAYSVHSDIGDQCAGVKINGLRVPLRSTIQNGDTIDIITSPQATPSQAWQEFSTTGKAKNSIRRFLKTQDKEQHIRLGETLLKSSLTAIDMHLSDATIEALLLSSKVLEPRELYYKIGHTDINLSELIEAAFPHTAAKKIGYNQKSIKNIPISGMIPGIAVHMGQCCYPLPGDNIAGIFKDSKGIQVHAVDCEILTSYEAYPELYVDLKWETKADSQDHIYSAKIALEVINNPGVLGMVTSLIGTHNGNISNITVIDRQYDHVLMHIELDVHNLYHLKDILNAIKNVDYINHIERVRSQGNEE
ncbi:MAG: GTP pyrophosphokinase [Alphaproteobacteria bacterium]|jgi:GTP pyrophosphokinase